jgi:hypothetical protein
MRKSTVHDYDISISDDRPWFITERRGKALDEIEQTLTTWRDMCAVLIVLSGPIALCRYVVPFVEESVESLEDECLVLFLFSLAH